MADALIFDTTFLIDFQRERNRRDDDGAAHAFLKSHADAPMLLPVTALGEFAEGFADRTDPVLQATVRHFEVLPTDAETAFCYGAITRGLRAKGRLIGSNDLWIAATALRHRAALVTRNVTEFRRIADLRVAGY